eukprot:905738-Rhodomonas_salina.2
MPKCAVVLCAFLLLYYAPLRYLPMRFPAIALCTPMHHYAIPLRNSAVCPMHLFAFLLCSPALTSIRTPTPLSYAQLSYRPVRLLRHVQGGGPGGGARGAEEEFEEEPLVEEGGAKGAEEVASALPGSRV